MSYSFIRVFKEIKNQKWLQLKLFKKIYFNDPINSKWNVDEDGSVIFKERLIVYQLIISDPRYDFCEIQFPVKHEIQVVTINSTVNY